MPADAAAPGTTPAPTAAIAPAAAPVQLLMVERDGCIYCDAWRREIMPAYDKTPEGRAAPLLRVPIDGPWPDGLALDRAPWITPTFILLRDGKEVSRLEGYPGEMYFWPMFEEMLAKAGIPVPQEGG